MRGLVAFAVVGATAFEARDGLAVWGFGPPATINTNADSNSGDDSLPQIAADNKGYWVAVWSSNENLGGTAGTDHDIFVSVTSPAGAESWNLFN